METWDLSTNKHYSSYVGKYSEIVSDAAHFEIFHKDKPKKRVEKLKVFYHANLMLRYQEYKLEKEIKDEKAKARASTTSPKYRKTVKVDDILRLKLENDRFHEKIAALDHALFEDHGVIHQSHLPPETTQIGNRTTQAATSNTSFAKKKLATIGGTSAIKKPESTSQKFHVNTLTGKQDSDLREKLREYELWSRHLQSSKDDLAKVNRLLKVHKERTGLDGGTRTQIKYPSELERDNMKLNLRIEPLEKAIAAKRELQFRLGKDLEAVNERLLEEQEKGRTILN